MAENASPILAQMSELIDLSAKYAQTYVPNLAAALAILVIGFWVAGRARRFLIRMGEKYDQFDVTLSYFLGSFARYTIYAVTLLTVLSQFGFETTSLIALLGAAGLAIGLALQGTLSNVAAGMMILFFRPFKVGDFIDAGGELGTVKQINLFATELASGDNVQVFLPNSRVWGAAIRNFSGHSTRRIEITLGISYDDDIDKAIKVAEQVIAANDKVRAKPAPLVAVRELADSSVNLRVRVWCANGDFWPVTYQLTKGFKEAYDKAGITIPYPTQTSYEHKVA
jgi:small conductance mechanosensitive channel